jgi:hypothetical protein
MNVSEETFCRVAATDILTETSNDASYVVRHAIEANDKDPWTSSPRRQDIHHKDFSIRKRFSIDTPNPVCFVVVDLDVQASNTNNLAGCSHQNGWN